MAELTGLIFQKRKISPRRSGAIQVITFTFKDFTGLYKLILFRYIADINNSHLFNTYNLLHSIPSLLFHRYEDHVKTT